MLDTTVGLCHGFGMRPHVTGLTILDETRATPGYTLFAPLERDEVLLIDLKGDVVHRWGIGGLPGDYGYLLPGARLLCGVKVKSGPEPSGGKGGHLKEFDWDGKLLWEHVDDAHHHDFRRLANGNTLYIGWEPMPAAAMERVKGAEPGSEDRGGIMWGDFLKEVTPEGEVAWEWHAHSDLALEDFPLHPMSTRLEFAHCNACEELPGGNIMLSFRRISTILIVDKRTKAVDWSMRDDEWGQQHDCTMLENGNILLFANGIHVPRGVFHSAVVEIDPRTRQEVWRYEDAPRWNFFSPNISGAQRLGSGNTLICEGLTGRLFEVTPDGEIVWEYINPYFGESGTGQANRVFRAYRYPAGSPELGGRL